MPKFYFALEKKTLQAYRDARNEFAGAIASMSQAEVADWKKELLRGSNIRALPEEVDANGFEAPSFYSVDQEGTASITVSGVLLNYVDLYDFYYDDPITTYGFIRESALRADEDPQVKKIQFHVNTGGGIVDGVDFTSQVIANLTKPTETVGIGMIASAGIWLFSQTDKIISADPTVFFGSIGVAVTYISRAKMYEEIGIEIIELVNEGSEDKRPDLSTDEGRAVIVKELNDLYKIFVDRVAAGRETTVEDVKANYGQGAVLIADQAIEVGMIDEVMLKTGGSKKRDKNSKTGLQPAKPEPRAQAQTQTNNEVNMTDIKDMTLDDFLAQNATAKAEHQKRLDEAENKGAKEMDKVVSRAAVVLESDVYSKKPKLVNLAVRALKREVSSDAIDIALSVMDVEAEDKNSKAADEEKAEETKAGTKDAPDPTKPKGVEDMKELAAQMKGGK